MSKQIPALAAPDKFIFGKKTLGRFFPMPDWERWQTIVKAAFELPLTKSEMAFFVEASGRRVAPTKPVNELWAPVGRQSGKTSTVSGIAAYYASAFDYKPFMRPGQKATILCIAVDRVQAKVLSDYIRAYFRQVPALRRLVVRETADGLELSTGAEIVVGTNSFRGVRGRTNILTLLDEVAYYRSETSANPDSELYSALLPCHANLGGMLIGISSPYRASGLLFDKWTQHWAKDDDDVLVIKGPSLLFNPELDQSVVARAYEKDAAAASAEYGAEWRRDLEGFIDSEVVKAAVVKGRFELPRAAGHRYIAFHDPASGGKDKFAIAVAHLEGKTIVLDFIREQPAVNTEAIVAEYSNVLKSYGLNAVTGDRVGGTWVKEAYLRHGINCTVTDETKSSLYLQFLPLLNAGSVELLDNRKLIAQICSLERTVARGSGRETVDAPGGVSEDLANVCAGACVFAKSKPRMQITDAMLREASRPTNWRSGGGMPSNTPLFPGHKPWGPLGNW